MTEREQQPEPETGRAPSDERTEDDECAEDDRRERDALHRAILAALQHGVGARGGR